MPSATHPRALSLHSANEKNASDEAVSPQPACPAANALVKRGDYWEVTYQGCTSILEDSRGLRYIALLMRDAIREPLHATELVAHATGNHSGFVELPAKDPLADAAAENRLIKRMEEIGFERNSACGREDYEKIAELDEELDQLAHELQGARTPHGRGRRASFNSSAERARKAVGKALSETIAKILTHRELEPFGRHLASAIHKGQWLSYNGTGEWEIGFPVKVAVVPGEKESATPSKKRASAKGAGVR